MKNGMKIILILYDEILREHLGEDEVVPTIWDNKWANKPAEASPGLLDHATEAGVKLATPALCAVCVYLGVRFIDWLWDKFFNEDDVETADTVAPSVSDRIDSLEAKVGGLDKRVDELKDSHDELKAIHASISRPKVA